MMLPQFLAFVCLTIFFMIAASFVERFKHEHGKTYYVWQRSDINGCGCLGLFVGYLIAAGGEWNDPHAPVWTVWHGLVFMVVCFKVGQALACWSIHRKYEEAYAGLLFKQGFREFPPPLPVVEQEQVQQPAPPPLLLSAPVDDPAFAFELQRFAKMPRGGVKG